MASGCYALQACQARDAVRALSIKLVAEARRLVSAKVVGVLATVTVFDGDGGEL